LSRTKAIFLSSFRRTGFLKAASCGLQKHFFRLRPPPRRSGRRVAEAGEGLSRLYASIEAGTIDGTDPMLKERVAALKATRDRALEASIAEAERYTREADQIRLATAAMSLLEAQTENEVCPNRPFQFGNFPERSGQTK
jgi:hypothetical protein